MKRLTSFIICMSLSFVLLLGVGASLGQTCASGFVPETATKASVLIDMDSNNVLYENNSTERMPVASIVKLMTIMLAFEHIDAGAISLDDKVMVSENASGMGGSQIFLDANCEYNLGELLKSVIVCSANDSSVAIAEHISGSEGVFVEKMNKRAKEMGLENTNYINCTGLPADNQYSCALDVAKILKNVLGYEKYHEYSSVWLEDFQHPSGRTTEMTNTNRLSRYYEGCIGGKTGSTNEAGYCLAVGARRNNLSLISVVLGANATKERFKGASDLLNYGFANYENYIVDIESFVDVSYKDERKLKTRIEGVCSILSEKGQAPNYEIKCYLPNKVSKCKLNQELGYVEIVVDGQVYSTLKVLADEQIDEPNFIDNLHDILD
ncbi:MAG: D-alanyl-D-alanine carboxypeptidase, partial [Clostridia bacterium]|nr:D-alanyl-D-alanine carboxypeptidase [Clostridia bacterium]